MKRILSILISPFLRLIRVWFAQIFEAFARMRHRSRQVMRRIMRRFMKVLLFASLGVIFLSGVGLSIPFSRGLFADFVDAQTIPAHFDAYLVDMGFSVSDVLVAGRVRSGIEDLRKAVSVKRGASIWALDLAQIHRNIRRLEWVRYVRVKRVLPNILHIELTEYEPFARLRHDGEMILVDAHGNHITRRDIAAWQNLPMIEGENAEYQAASLFVVLDKYPLIRSRLSLAQWRHLRRWTIRLAHGGEIHLPAENIEDALRRLMILERKRRVLSIANQVIDLRLAGQVVLGTRDAAPFTISPDGSPPRPIKTEMRL